MGGSFSLALDALPMLIDYLLIFKLLTENRKEIFHLAEQLRSLNRLARKISGGKVKMSFLHEKSEESEEKHVSC